VFDEIKNYPKIMEYLPNGIKAAYLNRYFLFNLIYPVDNSYYEKLEKIKTETQLLRGNGTFGDVGIQISNKWAKLLTDYPSLNGKKKLNLFI
jgi:hypothetical protein